jgi:hypothetical protein
MQVTPDRLSRLEPSKLQFVPLQYLKQQLYEYDRLIFSITIETLVIFRPGKPYNAVTGVITPGQNRMAMLTLIELVFITLLLTSLYSECSVESYRWKQQRGSDDG